MSAAPRSLPGSGIPITTPTPVQRAAIRVLVRKLLNAEEQGPQVDEWERALNGLVIEVYGLEVTS